ncbi:MAG: ABC-type Fe3+ transport system permease subunit [Phycisphaerales bacterium]|jgi:ABC-type Fe3+ transport system permease subunit
MPRLPDRVAAWWANQEPGRWGAAAVLALVLGLVGVAVLGPVIADLVRTARAGDLVESLMLNRADVTAMGRSVGYAVLIGVLAAAMGWPMAGLLVRRGPIAGVVLLPLLLPSYLAYAGWGQLRAPGTWLGDWLLTRSAAGAHWWPILAGRVFAVLGLALWASPIAGLVMAGGLARRGRGFDEALQMDRARWWRGVLERVRFHRGELLGGAGLVTLVMLGSAVPLHVAQVPTYTIRLWLRLAESAPGAWGQVWAASWPTLLVALVAAWVLARRVVRPAESDSGDSTQQAAGSRRAAAGGWLVWSLAVLVPVLICVVNLSGWTVFKTLWRLDRGAMLTSLGRGVVVGGVLVLLAVAVSVHLSSGRRGDRVIVRWAVMVALAIGLLPGFLIGATVSRFGLDGLGPVVAQVARYSFLGVLAGVWACRGESAEQRLTRQMDSDGGLRGWAMTALPAQWRVLLGIGLAGAALSLHEIEATVFVEPAGSGSLAQKMLGHLHFARMDELNAMSLVVVGLGLVPAAVGGALLAGRRAATGANRER